MDRSNSEWTNAAEARPVCGS